MKLLKSILDRGDMPKGSWIKLPVYEERMYTIRGSLSGLEDDQSFSNSGIREYLCRVSEYDKEAKLIKAIGVVSDIEVYLKGLDGYQFGIEEIDNLCFELYGIPRYGIISCNVKEEELKNAPRDGWDRKCGHWVTTQYIEVSKPYLNYGLKVVDEDVCLRPEYLYSSNGANCKYVHRIRPMFFIPVENLKIMIYDDNCTGTTIATAHKMFLSD